MPMGSLLSLKHLKHGLNPLGLNTSTLVPDCSGKLQLLVSLFDRSMSYGSSEG